MASRRTNKRKLNDVSAYSDFLNESDSSDTNESSHDHHFSKACSETQQMSETRVEPFCLQNLNAVQTELSGSVSLSLNSNDVSDYSAIHYVEP